MTYNYCPKHHQRYTNHCWRCDYESHLPDTYIHGWNKHMDRALAVNQAAHDAVLHDAGMTADLHYEDY